MRYCYVFILGCCLSLPLRAQTELPSSVPHLTNQTDSLSYCLGLSFGKNLQSTALEDINTEVMAQAILLGLQNQPQANFSFADASRYIEKYLAEQQTKQNEENLKAGQNFLEENKSKPGVIVRPSGLQYKIVREGTGPRPTTTDLVTVHFHGTLIDNTVFDSTKERGAPVQLYINDVIPGLIEALQLMKVGSKWTIYIPSDLAYGENPRAETVAPNSTLIFEVELLSIDS